MISSPMLPVAPPSKKPRSLDIDDFETSIASYMNHSLTRRRLEIERLKSQAIKNSLSHKHKSSSSHTTASSSSSKPESILKSKSRWTPSSSGSSNTKTPYVKQQKQHNGIPTTVDIKRRLDFAENYSNDKENINPRDRTVRAATPEENCSAPSTDPLKKIPTGTSSPTSSQDQFDQDLLSENKGNWKTNTTTSPFEFRTLAENIDSDEDDEEANGSTGPRESVLHEKSIPSDTTRTTINSSKLQGDTLQMMTTTTTSPFEFRALAENIGADDEEHDSEDFSGEDYPSCLGEPVLQDESPLSTRATTPRSSKLQEDTLQATATTTSPIEFRKLVENIGANDEEHDSEDFSGEDDSSCLGEPVLQNESTHSARAATPPSSKLKDDTLQATMTRTSPLEFRALAKNIGADKDDEEEYSSSPCGSVLQNNATSTTRTTTLSLYNGSNHLSDCHQNAIIPLPGTVGDDRLLKQVACSNETGITLYQEKAVTSELWLVTTLKRTGCWTTFATFLGDVIYLLSSLAWLVSIVLPWQLGRLTGLAISLVFCWWVFVADHNDNILFVTTNHYALV